MFKVCFPHMKPYYNVLATHNTNSLQIPEWGRYQKNEFSDRSVGDVSVSGYIFVSFVDKYIALSLQSICVGFTCLEK